MKSWIFLFSAALGAVVGKGDAYYFLPCECGTTNEEKVGGRIFGGKPFPENEYPWLGYLLEKKTVICGATLINNLYALTAGHCVNEFSPTDMKVVFGRHNVSDLYRGVDVKLRDYILHDDFESYEDYDVNDIALLRFEKKLEINRHVKPICLPNPASDYSGRGATISGWGKIREDSRGSMVALRGKVTILPPDTCKREMVGVEYLDTMMCAYHPKYDACEGDSGGPLTYETKPGLHELIGIVSFGSTCVSPMPGVFTKVSPYMKWIAEKTQDAGYCIST